MKKSKIQALRDAGFDQTVRTGIKRYYVRCSQCEAMVINGVACHERHCPNIPRREECAEES